jgi:GNAT superfamily N-acetyltransferase
MQGTPVVVRRATAGDIDAVWLLARDFATSFTPQRAVFEASFAELIVAPRTLVLVAVADSAVVGYLLAHWHSTFFANGPVAWVEEIMVDEASRRSRVGRSLMTAAEEWARSVDAAYLSLATRRAADFYRSLGYEESAIFFRKTVAPATADPARVD